MMIAFPPHLPTPTALKKREAHVTNESHSMLSIHKQGSEVIITSFDRMFNSSISKKKRVPFSMGPRHESFTKKMRKIFMKEPKYVERICVTALKDIILLHLQQ